LKANGFEESWALPREVKPRRKVVDETAKRDAASLGTNEASFNSKFAISAFTVGEKASGPIAHGPSPSTKVVCKPLYDTIFSPI